MTHMTYLTNLTENKKGEGRLSLHLFTTGNITRLNRVALRLQLLLKYTVKLPLQQAPVQILGPLVSHTRKIIYAV